jgi:hypothetical protein
MMPPRMRWFGRLTASRFATAERPLRKHPCGGGRQPSRASPTSLYATLAGKTNVHFAQLGGSVEDPRSEA